MIPYEPHLEPKGIGTVEIVPITSVFITYPKIEDYSLNIFLLEIRVEPSIAKAINDPLKNFLHGFR
jgi:hypothetical protein